MAVVSYFYAMKFNTSMIQWFAEKDDQLTHGLHEQLELFFHTANWQGCEWVDIAATSCHETELAECGIVDPKTTFILQELILANL